LISDIGNQWNFEFASTAKNIQYKIYKPFVKKVNVYYHRMLMFAICFIIKAKNRKMAKQRIQKGKSQQFTF